MNKQVKNDFEMGKAGFQRYKNFIKETFFPGWEVLDLEEAKEDRGLSYLDTNTGVDKIFYCEDDAISFGVAFRFQQIYNIDYKVAYFYSTITQGCGRQRTKYNAQTEFSKRVKTFKEIQEGQQCFYPQYTLQLYEDTDFKKAVFAMLVDTKKMYDLIINEELKLGEDIFINCRGGFEKNYFVVIPNYTAKQHGFLEKEYKHSDYSFNSDRKNMEELGYNYHHKKEMPIEILENFLNTIRS